MNFRKDEVIWKIHAFPDTEKFYITKYKVVKESTITSINVPSLIVRNVNTNYEDNISLRDANVIPNKYNSHRIFKNMLDVENYVNNPELWRPLGYNREEWDKGEKAKYLLSKLTRVFL